MATTDSDWPLDAGDSFSTRLSLLGLAMDDDETILSILDTFEDFTLMNEALCKRAYHSRRYAWAHPA